MMGEIQQMECAQTFLMKIYEFTRGDLFRYPTIAFISSELNLADELGWRIARDLQESSALSILSENGELKLEQEGTNLIRRILQMKPDGVSPLTSNSLKNVFVVHGHDNEVKITVARFLDNLGLSPIILHEQPDKGRFILEKLEYYAGFVRYAIVLLTPDNKYAETPDFKASTSFGELCLHLRSCARQNVIFELGFFVAKLKKERVCVLHKPEVDIPSDYQGILFKKLDAEGAWKLDLAKELLNAGYLIDLSNIK
jgi:predicted nucleotide-binding protein